MLNTIKENQPISIWDISVKMKASYGAIYYHIVKNKEKLNLKPMSDGSKTKVMVSLK
jgi:hypothetical protein